MLQDAREVEIMATAVQSGLRRAASPREPFEAIADDFLSDVLPGAALLDLGPGQWDLGEVARARGAARVAGIDSDPAVLELGRYKGFDAIESDLRTIPDTLAGSFDGVFCRGSINAFWLSDSDQVRLIERIAGLLRPEGWLWVVPWNVPPATFADVPARLALQADTFARLGFEAHELGDAAAARYGVSDKRTVNRPLFLGRLRMP